MLIILYAGSNGSGKTTIFSELNKQLNLEFINPDLIAKDRFSHIANEEERYRNYAMPEAEEQRKLMMENGEDFSFETVLSHPSKIKFLSDAKRQGYDIYSVYVGTNDPSINIGRVANRVSNGGHDVPDEKIIVRYYRAMDNLPELLNLSEEAVVLDNSANRPIEVLYKSEGKYYLLSSDNVPKWVQSIIETMKQVGYLSEYPTCLESEPHEESFVGIVKVATQRIADNNSDLKQGIDEWKREIGEVRNKMNKTDNEVAAPIKGRKDEQAR